MEIEFNVCNLDYYRILEDVAMWWTEQSLMTEEEISDECFGVDQDINTAQLILRYLKLWGSDYNSVKNKKEIVSIALLQQDVESLILGSSQPN